MDESINFVNTGGMFDKRVRRLQTFTIFRQNNGCFGVIDDRTGKKVGFGFASVEAADKAYDNEDRIRVVGY